MYYDTHAHINADVFFGNEQEIINEARQNGVEFINVVGFDLKTNALANQIALKNKRVFATCGLHPADIGKFTEQDLEDLRAYLNQDITVAVGECGLDYYWHKETKEKQIEYFKRQIELSNEFNKPLIIHVRDAMQDAYDVLHEASLKHPIRGVMHCFSGSVEMAKRFLELGLHISLGGPVTFKNALEPKEVAKIVPIDKLLIETDSPYLAPHPHRGKQNRPAFVKLVALEIAELRGMTIEEIAHHTTNNAKKLFKIQ